MHSPTHRAPRWRPQLTATAAPAHAGTMRWSRSSWSTATRIAGLRHLLSTVATVRDLPDDDPTVAALVEVLGVIAENKPRPTKPPATPREPPRDDDTAMTMFERHMSEGLRELQARPVPRLMQAAADRYIAAKIARQARAQSRRPVPPSLDGQVIELRQQLRRRPNGPEQ